MRHHCRRDALALASVAALLSPPALPLAGPAALPLAGPAALPLAGPAAPAWAADYDPGQSATDLEGSLGGLKPGTGRPLNALIKMRAETGVQRLSSDMSPMFKPGQILDELRTANGGSAQCSFAYPEEWTLSGGPNLDVRDVRQSDSAFVLVAPSPRGKTLEQLPDDFYLSILFDPAGKYGSYGTVEERKVVSSSVVPLSLPTGGKQMYRRIDLKFAPLSYNLNTVQRHALISATSVGGSVFILVTGCLANRWKKMQPELLEVQESFRVLAGARGEAELAAES